MLIPSIIKPFVRVLILFLLCVNLTAPGLSLAAEFESALFARTCLVVQETHAADAVPKTTLFDGQARPGPGKTLALYVDASIDAYVVAAALDSNRELAHGWLPQMVELEPWQGARLPQEGAAWVWDETPRPFEIQVLFLGKEEPGIGELEKLVGALRLSGDDLDLRRMQTKRLRQMLDAWMQQARPSNFDAGQTPRAWGGVLRGLKFPWKQNSQKIDLDDHGRGFFIYPVEAATATP
ncbi:MAG: hypothetical protein Q8R76_10425 [Candidatus Omnitrophota bacterium]|nr:hypothetical protein [Candidatus Omnitrophota bacterium]